MASIKAQIESAMKPDPSIKEEIKDEPMSDISEDDDDEDDYEDTGELNFPKQALAEAPWLVRVPKDLWSAIEKLKPDEPIQLGELLIWEDGQKRTMRWKINDNPPGFDLVAKEYDLNKFEGSNSSAAAGLKNTFVFSEKNLAGFRPNAYRYNKQNQASNDIKKEGGRVEKKRGPRTIPKHTTYVGTPSSELTCNPRETQAWRALQARKEQLATSSLRITQLRDVKASEQQPDDDTHFINISNDTHKKPRSSENKYQRMDEHDLIQILYDKFAQYRFWPLKALKEEVQQPEQFLRETLGKIAELVKTGQAANTWTLKQSTLSGMSPDDLARVSSSKEDGIAPVVEESEDDSDDDLDMEDVEI